VVGEVADKAVLDAAIIAGAQAVEHYEICRYGSLIAWAQQLGHEEVVRFLTHQSERREGRQYQAQHRGASQGRQQQGIDRSLMSERYIVVQLKGPMGSGFSAGP